MSKYIRLLNTIIAASTAFVFAPALQAQDSQTDNTQEEQTQTPDRQTDDTQTDDAQNDETQTPEQVTREDYKSPPSPEFLELQNQFTLSRSSALSAVTQDSPSVRRLPTSSLSIQSPDMPADKRKPREMAF